MKSLTLAQAAKICGGRVVGEGSTVILGFCSVEEPKSDELTFIGHSKLKRLIDDDSGTLYIVPEDLEESIAQGIIHPNATQAFRLILQSVYAPVDSQEIATSAVIDQDAQLGKDVSIGHYSVIESGAIIADGAVIGDNCFIGKNARVGYRSRIQHRVSIHHECLVGDDCVIADGTIIGGQGFGFNFEGGQWKAIPQIGRVTVGNGVHIGNNVCID